MSETNIVSISGGKDSQATVLLAIEREVPNLQCVFADTGHEHPQTYEFVDYLDSVLPVTIRRVSADFTDRIAGKRRYIKTHWFEHLYQGLVGKGEPHEEAAYQAQLHVMKAMSVMRPTGNPFLDMCLWKGRFPSTRRRFCTQHLKHEPIDRQVLEPAVANYSRVVSWQGVRGEESEERAQYPVWEPMLGTGDPESAPGIWIYRPILDWTWEDVFALIRRHGLRWNPLYEQGMARVGCMPCIHSVKEEMHEIATRFPEELERVAKWEGLVAHAARTGVSMFMDVRVTAKMLGTGTSTDEVHHETHGIRAYVDWARTARGGRQIDLIKAIEVMEADDDAPQCSSMYGLCE